MISRKFLVPVLVAAFVVLLLAAYWLIDQTLQSAEKSPKAEGQLLLRIPDTKFMGILPLYVADEKGFFDAHGIKVVWLDVRDPGQASRLFFSGQADLIMSTFAGLLPAEVRSPGTLQLLLAAAERRENPGSALLVRQESEIKSGDDLKGKALGTYSGSSQRAYALIVIEALGYRVPDDVELVQVASSAQVQGLFGGAFDVLFAVEPYLSIARRNGAQIIENAVRPRFIANPFWIGAAAVHKDFASQQSKVSALAAALSEAVKFIEANESEARNVLARRTSTPTDIAETSALYEWVTIPSEDQLTQMQALFELLAEQGLIETEIDAAEVFLGR